MNRVLPSLPYLGYAVAFAAAFYVFTKLPTVEGLLVIIVYQLWRIERQLKKGEYER